LGKVGDMLQRMRELAVQASNATNSASDRTALQAEVSQLAAEIDRVAKQTNFNGQKILDGSFAGAVFQVGANSGDNVTLGALADTRSSKLSVVNYAQNTVTFNTNDNPDPAIENYAVEIEAGKLKITIESTPSQEIELEAIKPATSSLERLGQVVTAINNKSVDTGVTAYMSRNETTGDYKIELMSAKTDAEGKPYGVTFTGFTEATTGIGAPTDGAYKQLTTATTLTNPTAPTATLPAAISNPASGNAALTTALDASINTYLTNVKSINAALGTSAYSLTDIANLESGIAEYAAAAAGPGTTEVDSAEAITKIRTAVTNLSSQSAGAATSITSYNNSLGTINDAVTAATANGTTDPNNILNSLSAATTPTQFETAIGHLKTWGLDLGDPTQGGFSLSNYAEDPTATPLVFGTEAPKTAADALKDLKAFAAAFESGGLNMSPDDNKVNQRGLESIDVTTQEGAWVALKKIDSAIDQINASRATLGAMQTRFETAVNNIDIQVENLSAARGRIMDADFAKETAELSRTQILQQAGTAMVAQANQIPQNVLQLLQG